MSIESTPALCQASNPVSRSRIGSGPSGDGCGVSELPPDSHQGETVKPYSLCTPRAGTTGLLLACSPAKSPVPTSLSSATTVSTRLSVAWSWETAAAPIEWPMMAIRVVRPGVTVSRSGERSKRPAYGLWSLTSVRSSAWFLYGCALVEVKNERASFVPITKLDSCCDGTPGQPYCSPARGSANGLQKGRAFTGLPSCGSVSLVPWPWTS